ncbi:sialidase family protein [Larkinella rosea]|nr:sialidase family protein [Larkinella rosea]
MTKLIFCTLLLLTFGTVWAQTDPVSSVALQLNPGDDNPRNSEGDFITLKDGRILFVYSHYTGGSTSDHAPAHLAGRFSKDGGKTWTDQDQLIVAREGDMNVMSVSLLRLQNGKIALFYLKKNSEQDCIPQMRISTDEAKTWSAPMPCITDKAGYFVLNNNRVIQLKNGRLLMAVAQHQSPGGKWQNQATLFSYFSDDNGATWKSSPAVPNPENVLTQEPGVIELKDGRVMMIIRAGGGFQQLSYSSDKGQTWSPIEPSTLHSPVSPATIARIPSTGDLLVVWNNNDGSNPEIRNARTPLTVAISKDEGKTWQHIRNIESDPQGWYCYIAIHFVKKDVLLSYCAGNRIQKNHLSITRINRLNLAKLYQ